MIEEVEEGGPPCEKCGGFTEPLTAGTIVQLKKVLNGIESEIPYELPYDVFRCPVDGWETLQNELPEPKRHFFFEAADRQKELAAKVTPVCVVERCYFRAPKPEMRDHMKSEHGVIFPSKRRDGEENVSKTPNKKTSGDGSAESISLAEAMGMMREKIVKVLPNISISINSESDEK